MKINIIYNAPDDLRGLVTVREDVEQVCSRHEVEARESKSLRLQIFCESLLTQGELALGHRKLIRIRR